MEKLIAKDLLSIKAVFFRPDQPFTWASGIKSPIYCDNRLTLSYPRVRDVIEQEDGSLVDVDRLIVVVRRELFWRVFLVQRQLLVALRIVESRCATTRVVLPLQSSSRACWISTSVVLSRALVASSMIKILGLVTKALAISSL